jgi:uncharacterized protein (TIGR02271 family)
MDGNTDRIIPLDELDDFQVAEGDPDVRGWEVFGSDGRLIGEVDDLLVDTAAMKVRYLDVDLDGDLLADDAERHVLIPIGYARLDDDDDQIFVDSLTSTDLSQIPEYRHGPVTQDYETSLRTHFDRDRSVEPATGSMVAGDPAYDDTRFYGSRRGREEARTTVSEEQLAVDRHEHVTGEVTLQKDVETHHVSEQVPTRHEEVVVERRPAGEHMSAEPRIEGDEVHIPVHEEEVEVRKRTVPREEIVVRKEDRIEEETVEADLRRERVDIKREGDVNVRDARLSSRDDDLNSHEQQ